MIDPGSPKGLPANHRSVRRPQRGLLGRLSGARTPRRLAAARPDSSDDPKSQTPGPAAVNLPMAGAAHAQPAAYSELPPGAKPRARRSRRPLPIQGMRPEFSENSLESMGRGVLVFSCSPSAFQTPRTQHAPGTGILCFDPHTNVKLRGRLPPPADTVRPALKARPPPAATTARRRERLGPFAKPKSLLLTLQRRERPSSAPTP
jgi:hypothetical protein